MFAYGTAPELAGKYQAWWGLQQVGLENASFADRAGAAI